MPFFRYVRSRTHNMKQEFVVYTRKSLSQHITLLSPCASENPIQLTLCNYRRGRAQVVAHQHKTFRYIYNPLLFFCFCQRISVTFTTVRLILSPNIRHPRFCFLVYCSTSVFDSSPNDSSSEYDSQNAHFISNIKLIQFGPGYIRTDILEQKKTVLFTIIDETPGGKPQLPIELAEIIYHPK